MSLIHDYQASFRERNAYLSQEMTSKPVDWADAPFKHTVRPGGFEVPLPNGKRLAAQLAARQDEAALSVLSLAQMFWYANGLLRRKFDVDWAKPAPFGQRLDKGTYARGTASGGGLYPVELYLVTSDLDGLPDGIYHHCEARSSLQRVRAGRFGAALTQSWGGARYGTAQIVLTVRFWKNVFKYKNFGYQVMTEDCGAMLGTLIQVAQDLGIASHAHFIFADHKVSDLIGLDADDEAVMAVIELGNGSDELAAPFDAPVTSWHLPARHLERSRHVVIPELIHDVHAATLIDEVQPLVQLAPWQSRAASISLHPLPAPATISSSLELFINRRSSMGRQCVTAGLTQDELGFRRINF